MLNTEFLKNKKLIAPDRNNKEAILKEEIGRGGEGAIYTIKDYPSAVAKIYYEDKRDSDREEKLKILVKNFFSTKIPSNFKKEITFPITRLYSENKFVGYIMRKVGGKPLKVVIAGDKRLKAFYPNANRIDLIKLSIDFLKKVDYLHSLNILIGDINLNNILINKEDLTKCFLVDIDASQVDNLPCPVGTDEFTPPNLQGKNFKNILRKKDDEYFSIAIMLFMILMLGKHPYSRQDGSSPAENIKNHKFPYPVFGYIELHKNAPKGYYKNIWTHFPTKLRNLFYETFANDKRFSPKEWIRVLTEYKKGIENKKFTNELAPISFYSSKKTVSVICESCGKKFDIEENYLNSLKAKRFKIICNKCKDIEYGLNAAKKTINQNSNNNSYINLNKYKTTTNTNQNNYSNNSINQNKTKTTKINKTAIKMVMLVIIPIVAFFIVKQPENFLHFLVAFFILVNFF